MKEYTKDLAEYMSKTRYEELPEKLITVMKRCLLDTVGCAIAGSVRPEIKKMVSALADGSETGNGTVFCDGRKIPLTAALTVNGSMNHAVELDDLHKPSKIHAGTVIVPTVLTVGAAEHISGKDALLSMALGYETMLRTAMALGTDSHRRRGWHATATCGSFGAAVSVSKIYGLDKDGTANALGLAGTQTGGLMAYTADGSMSKRFHAGKAASNGEMAARLAKYGYTGPTYVFEAPDGGYAHAASDKYDLDIMTDLLGEKFYSEDMGHKFYACCGHIHQAIYAAIQIRNKYSLKPEDIEKIKVLTYDVSGMAWGFSEPPANTVEAQFSFPYAVSVALIDGKAFLDQFAIERLSDERILSLAKKVEVETSDKYTSRYPEIWSSGVEITLKDGKKYFEESIGAKGDPTNPLTDSELADKFKALTNGIISEEKQNEIIKMCSDFENIGDIDTFMQRLY